MGFAEVVHFPQLSRIQDNLGGELECFEALESFAKRIATNHHAMVFEQDTIGLCLRTTLFCDPRTKFRIDALRDSGARTRFVSSEPLLGSMLVFAKQDYRPGGFYDQPPIRAMRAVFANIDMSITRRAEQFLPPGEE